MREPTWAAELYGDEDSSDRRWRLMVAWASLASLVAVAAIAGLVQAGDEDAAQAATTGQLETQRSDRELVKPEWRTIGDVDPKIWSQQVFPAAGPAEAIGGHTSGCLRGAVALPADGLGYQAMRIARWRFFGHPVLIDYIRDLGRRVHLSGLGLVLVSDLSQPRGGPTMTDHKSHQTGLDVDIWYGYPPEALDRRLSAEERQKISAPVVVNRATMELTDAWQPEMGEMIRVAADDERVSRIFVHPAVKRELCETATGDRAWLNKVRPWWNHHDHIHVRLLCPEGSPECVDQAPLRPGDGCGPRLDWWFRKLEKSNHDKVKAAKLRAKKRHLRHKKKRSKKAVAQAAEKARKARFAAPPERCIELLR